MRTTPRPATRFRKLLSRPLNWCKNFDCLYEMAAFDAMVGCPTKLDRLVLWIVGDKGIGIPFGRKSIDDILDNEKDREWLEKTVWEHLGKTPRKKILRVVFSP